MPETNPTVLIPASKTDQVRTWNMILYTISILATLFGWLFLGKPPGDLSFLLGTLAATTAIGEGSARAKKFPPPEGT